MSAHQAIICQEAVLDDGRERLHNHGMTNGVEAAWRKILTAAGEPRRPEASPLFAPFSELVLAAHSEPLLRQLHPWTGMWELHFSRCTEIRYTWDVHYIGTLGDGRYYIEGPSRTSPRIAEADSAQAAVAMVIDRLPSRCGPAFIGTAEELDAYERPRNGR
ncbi:DUF6193 family natural product biosynthesis protein [Streptomyces sp. NPDC102364]|uniref:DUF6193 family natural product biosynthesis protein n=1 Tax=Streptomyces sp. NPDC102364 TaxID=3366161 RepID=UPI00381955F0